MATKKTTVYGYNNSLTGTCGADIYHSFHLKPTLNSWNRSTSLSSLNAHGGIDISCAGFIDTPDCKKAYEWLCKKYTLVYQSEVRRNTNSGHNFFFCVFDRKKAK